MRHLCDTNVWLALTVSAHPHQVRATEWFQGLTEADSAEFCRAAQTSFLRLLRTPAAVWPAVLTNEQALECYRTLRTDACVAFCPEPVSVEPRWHALAAHSQPAPKRWMDAYLAAFAITGGPRLVTFDGGFRVYPGLDVLAP